MPANEEMSLRFVETILNGSPSSGDRGIVGGSDYDTHQMRAEWMVKCMPKSAHMYGVEWDGVDRLPVREKDGQKK